jgi:hypothetical protein
VKCGVAFMGTPGVLFSVRLQHYAGSLVVIDRQKDTWERVAEGEHRYAVQHEPSRRATTCRSAREAREYACTVAVLERQEAQRTVDSWAQAA